MTPTEEQLSIISAAKDSSESLLINALAGAAKTTTLELICRAIPPIPILSLAFNKRIAEEMKKRLPGHVTPQTMNATGHRVWAATTGQRRLIVDSKKSYNLLREQTSLLKGAEKEVAYETFSETLKAIARAKLLGYVPDCALAKQAKGLTSREDFHESFDEELEPVQKDLIDGVLIESIKLAYAGSIDFDDQIYMPTLFGGAFPRFPLVLVDEAQDLSPLNHAMLKKLVTKRLIAVGDPWQSIYGFRGAVTSSMSLLRQEFNCREMTLSISFRCPRAVVRRAHFRVPHMRWPDWAAEGEVQTLENWNAGTIPDGAAIICRNNAPLFSCALHLLRAGRGCQLVGTDLGPGLIRVLKKLGPEHLSQEDTFNAIEVWEKAQIKRAKNEGPVRDKAECLRVFASFGPDLGAAIAYAQHLFSSSGPIQLLSGHKAKGLEWDTVYHLDPHRIPSTYAKEPEAKEQEWNVKYVIETRAKKSLFLVTMEGFDA